MAAMEVKDLSEIHFADYNPRILSDHMGAALDASMTTFGDISGITFNAKTQTLVTGHQRLRILEKRYPGRVKIYVEHRFDAPDEYATIALGYVSVEGTNLHLAYRETFWDIGTEKAANVAANKIEARFDDQLLAQLDYDLSQLENGDELLALTGQTDEEIDALLRSVGSEPDPEPNESNGSNDDGFQRLTVRLTDEQYATIYQAIGMMKHERTLINEPNPDLDANALYYIAKHYVETTSHNIEPPADPADIPPEPTDLSSLPAEPAAA